VAVSFDLFGTLVEIDAPSDPAAAVADELRERGVSVPPDFADAYREPHVDAPDGAEIPLPAHVTGALASREVRSRDDVIHRAVIAAFDPTVERRRGALAAVEAASKRGAIGLCSNCSVPELVEATLARADLSGAFGAVVTSVGCGWRKPDARAFEVLADRLGVETASIHHVGDDPATDGGIEAAGGRFIDIAEMSLSTLAARLESKTGSLESGFEP
jgi:FMN phosphatase YigB (HAD superfamily)